MRAYLLAVAASCIALTAYSRGQDRKAPPEQLVGTWSVTSLEQNGQKAPAEALKGHRLVFTKNKFVEKDGDKVLYENTYTIDPEKKPRWIDFQREVQVNLGIYKLDGDTLTICVNEGGKEGARPKEFTPEGKTC